MEYSRDTVGRMPLEGYVEVVSHIYAAHDEKRSIWDVWCHALHHAAAVAETVRKGGDPYDLTRETADFALWLFTIIDKLRGPIGQKKTANETSQEYIIRIRNSISDILWDKYPAICPKCYERRTEGGTTNPAIERLMKPCDCLSHDRPSTDKDAWRRCIVHLRGFAQVSATTRPQDIDSWQGMFGGVFRFNLRQLSLNEVALHLMEEMGELSDALVRMYSYKRAAFVYGEPDWHQARLEGQIADVFSHLFGLLEKINLMRKQDSEYDNWISGNRDARFHSLRLSDVIWKRYGSDKQASFWCPFCENVRCCCDIALVPLSDSMESLTDRVSGALMYQDDTQIIKLDAHTNR